jgi:hypothetical protein
MDASMMAEASRRYLGRDPRTPTSAPMSPILVPAMAPNQPPVRSFHQGTWAGGGVMSQREGWVRRILAPSAAVTQSDNWVGGLLPVSRGREKSSQAAREEVRRNSRLAA